VSSTTRTNSFVVGATVVVAMLAATIALGGARQPAAGGAVSFTPAAPSGLGSTVEVVANFARARFSGHQSQSDDGRTRWVGHRSSDHASVEIVGDDVVTEISVTVIGGAKGGRLVNQFLNTYAPGSTSFLRHVLATTVTDAEAERSFGDRVVRIERGGTGGQSLVTVAVRSQP
jgi:hypothetical protein